MKKSKENVASKKSQVEFFIKEKKKTSFLSDLPLGQVYQYLLKETGFWINFELNLKGLKLVYIARISFQKYIYFRFCKLGDVIGCLCNIYVLTNQINMMYFSTNQAAKLIIMTIPFYKSK